jgi:hypothetical protein
MLSGLGNPEACFLSGIKAFFIEHKGYDDLRRAAEGGHDAAAYLYAILLYNDNEGVHEAGRGRQQYDVRMAEQRGGVCLCMRRPRVRSSTRHDAFGVNCCRLRHRCAAISPAQAMAGDAAWKKNDFEFLSFEAKTVGCTAKL